MHPRIINVVNPYPDGIIGVMKTFGEKMFELRKRRGISQDDLAAAFGVHQTQISRWESNNAPPEKPGRLVKLAELLGCTVDYLINDHIDEMPRPLNEDERVVLRVARKLGLEEAIGRLTLAAKEAASPESTPRNGVKQSRPGSTSRGRVTDDEATGEDGRRRRPAE